MDSYTLLDAVARIAYGADFARYYSAPGDREAAAEARQRRRGDKRFISQQNLPDLTGMAERLEALRAETIDPAQILAATQKAGAIIRSENAAHAAAWTAAANRLHASLAKGASAAFDAEGYKPKEFWHHHHVLRVIYDGYRVWANNLQKLMSSEKPDQPTVDAWMLNYYAAEKAENRPTPKYDNAIKDCMNLTGATFRQAKAALPTDLKRKRGRPGLQPRS